MAPDGSIYFTEMPFGPQHDTIINRFDPATKMLSVFTASANTTRCVGREPRP